MSEAMMNEILKRLDLIGEKLGQGGEYVFQLAVRQAYIVDGWYAVILGGGFLVLAALAVVMLVKFAKLAIKDDESAANWGVPGGILLVVSGIGILANLFGGINHILNPEYYALLDLAWMLGK